MTYKGKTREIVMHCAAIFFLAFLANELSAFDNILYWELNERFSYRWYFEIINGSAVKSLLNPDGAYLWMANHLLYYQCLTAQASAEGL